MAGTSAAIECRHRLAIPPPNIQELLEPAHSRWAQLPEERRERFQRFQILPPDVRDRVRQRYEQWQKLSPSQRERLKSQWQDISPDTRRQLPEDWLSKTPEQREKIRQQLVPCHRWNGALFVNSGSTMAR